MTKKRLLIIASILLIVLIAAGVFVVLMNQKKVPSSVRPGDKIDIAKAPSYKACSIVSTATIKTAFGKDLSQLSTGARAGIVGLNGQPADACDYTMTLKGTSKDTLSIQVYDYQVQGKGSPQSAENPDQTWSNISFVKYPGDYLPTYYKKADTTDGKSTAYYLRVINGPKNYLFVITQPKNAITYQNRDALPVLEALAIGANYTVTNTATAPPAPKVSEQ